MSADLYLRVFDPTVLPKELVRSYLELDAAPLPDDPREWDGYQRKSEQRDELHDAIYAVDRDDHGYHFLGDDLWIGHVSYLKAGLDGNEGRWVPRVVSHFDRAYARSGHIANLTPGFCAHLLTGFNLPHTSHYENQRDARGGTRKRGIYGRSHFDTKGVAKARKVKRFLQEHRGMLSFLETQ